MYGKINLFLSYNLNLLTMRHIGYNEIFTYKVSKVITIIISNLFVEILKTSSFMNYILKS